VVGTGVTPIPVPLTSARTLGEARVAAESLARAFEPCRSTGAGAG